MTTFQINKSYSTPSICDSNCIFKYTVIARTAKTITIKSWDGSVRKCRINKKLTVYRNIETILPEGHYSMCPIIDAEKVAA